MTDKRVLKFDKWTQASEEEQGKIKKAFRFKGYGMLCGYILFLLVIIALIVVHLFSETPSMMFIGFYVLIILATVAGIGNQVKSVREMKQRLFDIRDGYVKEIKYISKRQLQISSYEVEVKERNVIKVMVVQKGYRAFKPKVGDHVLLAKPQKTTSIYFYELLD